MFTEKKKKFTASFLAEFAQCWVITVSSVQIRQFKQKLLLGAVCEIILPGPEAAARAAAAAPNKKRKEAEAAIADAVSRTLHMLGSLKQIVSLIAGQF